MIKNQKIINLKKKKQKTIHQINHLNFGKIKGIGINDSHQTYNTNNQIRFKNMK